MSLFKDILKNSKFDFYSNSYEGEFENPVKDLLKQHPKQFISDINMNIWKVDYQYTTPRGNRLTGEKFIIENNNLDNIDIKAKLLDWVSNHNKQFPRKFISNVNILEVKQLGSLTPNLF